MFCICGPPQFSTNTFDSLLVPLIQYNAVIESVQHLMISTGIIALSDSLTLLINLARIKHESNSSLGIDCCDTGATRDFG